MKKSLGAKTIVYPAPVFIIGSYDTERRPNMMNAAWGGICSSEPPSIAVSIRPERYTYANITRRQAFTVNIPSVALVEAADYVGICSGRDGDKFAAAGLTAVSSDIVDAPYVAEFPLVLECALRHEFELGVHTQFVGEILDVKANEEILDGRGMIDVAKLQPFIFSPGDSLYYRVGECIGRAFSIGRKE
ncbi:MAG: flavin reductase family protein [Nitrospiraceae bacterium]|nr:flavin reductase family protein [Nitrospiraceae bacterium]